jgi:hypothetical protein
MMKVVPVCHFCRAVGIELRWTNGFTAMRCIDCMPAHDTGWHDLPVVRGPLFISGLCENDIILNRLERTAPETEPDARMKE